MADSAPSIRVRTEDPEDLRAALIDQLSYLIDEVEALKRIVDCVPERVREGRPTPDALSMKEIYGAIVVMDERVHRPRIERIARSGADGPAFETVQERALVAEEDWNAMPMEDILGRVQTSREALVALLGDLSAEDWSMTGQFGEDERSVYEIAHRITQDDTRRLRDLGHRLHDANLTQRDRDLPK